jgi:hypothetical protein
LTTGEPAEATPQQQAQLPKEIYVGTTVLVSTWINWIKMPFFVAGDIITAQTLKQSLVYFPLVPVGVWAGRLG